MSKLVTVEGDQGGTVTVVVPVTKGAEDVDGTVTIEGPAAAAATRVGQRALRFDRIDVKCTCAGPTKTPLTAGTFAGKGNASIPAGADRVRCQGAPLVLEDDTVEVECDGVITMPDERTVNQRISVRVAVTQPNQATVRAGVAG